MDESLPGPASEPPPISPPIESRPLSADNVSLPGKVASTPIRRGRGRRVVRTFAYAVGTLVVLPILLVIDSYCIVLDVRPLARKAPDSTPVMAARLRDPKTPRPLRHRFVALKAISPHLTHAVIVHEDATFFQHQGYDPYEIRAAVQKSWRERRLLRGASTITNQLARNLYLGTDRTPLRKLREIPLTFRLERALEKRRILELYLNFAEWGPGVFGAEAASRYHFGHSARDLSPAEAALLAAALPSPRRSTPAHPSSYLRRRAAIILARMRARGWLTPEAQANGRHALGLGGAPSEAPETPLDSETEPPPPGEAAPESTAPGIAPEPESVAPESEASDPGSAPADSTAVPGAVTEPEPSQAPADAAPAGDSAAGAPAEPIAAPPPPPANEATPETPSSPSGPLPEGP
jgi:monofunctional biosynthetic peptidoglycan transglycosylase